MFNSMLAECPQPGQEDAQTLGLEYLRKQSEIGRVVQRVTQAMAEKEFGAQEIHDVQTCLEEALRNAIVHGNQGDSGKVVYVCYDVAPHWVWTEVGDQGKGFDPDSIPDRREPNGSQSNSMRGIHLVRSLMSWVRFSHNGSRIQMCKFRLRQPPANWLKSM